MTHALIPVGSPAGDAWRRFLHGAIARVWFDRITVRGSISEKGPLLLVSCHRNGAVDGFLLHAVHPRVEFMIAARLTRKPWQRFYFGGIPVERAKDRSGPADHRAAMERCLGHLVNGGALCVFPEGTSTLGPRHLPFHSGAARLALDYLEKTGTLPAIVPVGLHYDDPTAFRSRVEVVAGPPINLSLPETPRLADLRQAIERSLLHVGANFEDATHQEIAESAAALTEDRYDHLKAREQRLSSEAATRWSAESPAARQLAAQPWPRPAALWTLLLTPLVLPGALFNAPVLLAATAAAKRFADGVNVLALWKILAGTAMAFVWAPLIVAACGWARAWTSLLVYAACTALALALWRPLRLAGRAARLLLAPAETRRAVRRLHTLLHHV